MARYVESVACWANLRIEGEGVQRKSNGLCARRDGALLIVSVISVPSSSVVGRENAVRGGRIDGARPDDGPGVPRVLCVGDAHRHDEEDDTGEPRHCTDAAASARFGGYECVRHVLLSGTR